MTNQAKLDRELAMQIASIEGLQTFDGRFDGIGIENKQMFILSNLFSLEKRLPIGFDLAPRAIALMDDAKGIEDWNKLYDEVVGTLRGFI